MIKIGKVIFDTQNKIIIRKPTPSNLLDNAGSDNDIYLGNMSQENVVNELKKILVTNDLKKIDGTLYTFNFYQSSVEMIFKINNQKRISFRILGKDRLYGMINYCNENYNINLDIDNILIKIDIKNKNISFVSEDESYID